MIKRVLVRHGESERNLANRFICWAYENLIKNATKHTLSATLFFQMHKENDNYQKIIRID